MRRSEERKIVWNDTRGGRNDTDPPMSLRADQCVELLNVDWKDTTFARKRGGATSVSLTGGTAFQGPIYNVIRHVPGSTDDGAELWATDVAPIVKRLTGGTTWANVTLDDAITFAATDMIVVGASLNGKLFLAYDSAQDRLHVYDPGLATPRVRRVGFATPGAPTLANQGAGTYAATLRYVRVRWLQLTGSVVTRRSEPGAATSFTPSGSGQYMRITQPSPPGEGETHWEIEVSTDNLTWYQRAGFERSNHQAIATTFIDDDEVVGNYTTYKSVDQVGQYTRFPSVKYLITDGNRLLGAGAWESAGANSGGKGSRVWFTPVLGAADRGDDERLVNTTTQKNWVDLNENDGGAVTGLGGPLNGVIYAFKYRQVWRLRPTGDVTAPYLPRRIRDDIGCIHHKSITLGEDHRGEPALYFMSHRGPYRITVDGVVQYLGRDNQVTWRSMNLTAFSVVTHALFYPDLHQWWVWIATGGSSDPDVKMILDVQKAFPDETGEIRGGWAKHTGPSAAARCACLFSATLGSSMSRDLKPYIGRTAASAAILKCDTTDLDDAGTDVQAYAKSRPVNTAGELGRKLGMAEPYLLAKALSGVTLTLTSDRDFGAETRTHTQTLTAAGSETRVFKKFEGGEVGEADVIQLQIGDGAAQDGAWSIDAVVIPTLPQEQK